MTGKFGQWDAVRLYSTPVNVSEIKCEACGEIFRVYPTFVISGTTLTLSALILIAFIYEYSNLLWRDLPENFVTNMIRLPTVHFSEPCKVSVKA